MGPAAAIRHAAEALRRTAGFVLPATKKTDQAHLNGGFVPPFKFSVVQHYQPQYPKVPHVSGSTFHHFMYSEIT